MFGTKSIRIVGALVVLLSVGQAAMAQGRWNQPRQNRWENQRFNQMQYLGQANVDGRSDHDFIRVGRNDGTFRSLQIRVENAPIEFQRVVVHYANGEQEDITLRNRIPAGGQTRMIDLRGRDRAIQGVEVWYARASWRSRQQPRITLYGR